MDIKSKATPIHNCINIHICKTKEYLCFDKHQKQHTQTHLINAFLTVKPTDFLYICTLTADNHHFV